MRERCVPGSLSPPPREPGHEATLQLNVHLLQWIHSYLSNRSQTVVVGGEESSMLPVVSGVPQGLLSGPLLFLIYINDIVTCISPSSKLALFADDIALYRSTKFLHQSTMWYYNQTSLLSLSGYQTTG